MLGRGNCTRLQHTMRNPVKFSWHRFLPARKGKCSHCFSSISWLKMSSLWLNTDFFFFSPPDCIPYNTLSSCTDAQHHHLRSHWGHTLPAGTPVGPTAGVSHHSWSWGCTESNTAQLAASTLLKTLASSLMWNVRGAGYKYTPLLGLCGKKGPCLYKHSLRCLKLYWPHRKIASLKLWFQLLQKSYLHWKIAFGKILKIVRWRQNDL